MATQKLIRRIKPKVDESQLIENTHLACKIVIQCEHPTSDGKMHVNMTHEGDPALVSYLLDNAQNFLNHEDV